MGQVLKYATVKDVQILLRKVEYAKDMEESIYAATKDAQIKPRVMECALDMGQRSNCAAVTDAKIIFKIGGVCVRHGTKLKRCSSEGCSNQVKKEGVCRRHGAYRK